MTKRTSIAVAAALAATFSLAACSSTGSTAKAASGADAASTVPGGGASAGQKAATSPPAAQQSTAAGGGSAGETNACTLLSVAQASSLTGTAYSAATPSTIAPGQDQCSYDQTSGLSMLVIVYQADSGVTMAMMKGVLSGTGTPVAVPGVGDQAFAGAIELDVQAGSRLVAVQNADGIMTGDYSKATAVAKAVIAALH